MTSQSYYPNYYSVEDILATQERVPCKFLINVPDMGKLNPSAEEKDLQAGTLLEIPVWLVEEVSKGSQPIAIPELPKIYRESYREILQADANAVDLHKFNLFFYELGLHCNKFSRRNDVQAILLHTFRTRFRQLMDLAHNSLSHPLILQKLDILERKIFLDENKAREKLNNWLINSGAQIQIADVVVNHKKRKRAEVGDLL